MATVTHIHRQPYIKYIYIEKNTLNVSGVRCHMSCVTPFSDKKKKSNDINNIKIKKKKKVTKW